MEQSPRNALLDVLLGAPSDIRTEIVVALNRPPTAGRGKGSWREYRFDTTAQASAFLGQHAEKAELYVALARFQPGDGAKKSAVLAKTCISADVDIAKMPGPNQAEQARQLVGSISCPKLMVHSGGGFHPHLLLHEENRVEYYIDVEDGVRHVEILGVALRLFLEGQAHVLFGTGISLDHCHGAQRVWRVPTSWNLKAAPDARELTADRNAWRPVRLLDPSRPEGFAQLVPADLSFLIPYMSAAEEEWEGKGPATLDTARPEFLGSAEASVAARPEGAPYFDRSLLPERLATKWPMSDGDQSAHDYGLASSLAEAGWSVDTASAAIQARRAALPAGEDRAKGERLDYIERTVQAAFLDNAPRARRAALPPRIPFPIEQLPPSLTAYIQDGARALHCAPEAIAVPLLTALGAAIGMSRTVKLKRSWFEPALLWAVVVLPSGCVKSPALDVAVRPVRERQQQALSNYREELEEFHKDEQQFKQELAEWKKGKGGDESPIAPHRPVARRGLVSDTTLEGLIPILDENPRGVLLLRDELAGWIKGFDAYRNGRGGDMEQWLSIHRAGAVLVDRKMGRQVLSVPHAFVAITGGIQPMALRRLLTDSLYECGLPARLLFSMPEAPRRVWTEEDITDAQARFIERVFNRLSQLQPKLDGPPRWLGLDPEAKRIWVKFFNAVSAAQGGMDTEDAMRPAFSKLEAYAPRLALILTLVAWATSEEERAPGLIPGWAMEAGVALTRHFAREAERVFALFKEPSESRHGRELSAWIERQGQPVTIRDVVRGRRRYRGKPREAEEALGELVSRGLGVWHLVPPPAGGGHATREFRLHVGGGDTRDAEPASSGPFEDRVSPDESASVDDPDAPAICPDCGVMASDGHECDLAAGDAGEEHA